MLKLNGISKTYADGTQALSGIQLEARDGEIVALVGGSGCGKTTLLRLLAGLDSPSEGTIMLDGVQITGPHEQVGVIFQEPRLFAWLNVADNIGFGLAGRSPFEREGLIANALARVGLAGFEGRWPRELSGGQQQRVAIARALITRPRLLLMDEPFSALDPTTRGALHRHLLALWGESRPTILFVTHDADEAVALADRVLVMQPEPGRLFSELGNRLSRPRDRLSPGFEALVRNILTDIDHSMKSSDQHPHAAGMAEAAWW
jgi:sulfonate transport system ATP-binding protein